MYRLCSVQAKITVNNWIALDCVYFTIKNIVIYNRFNIVNDWFCRCHKSFSWPNYSGLQYWVYFICSNWNIHCIPKTTAIFKYYDFFFQWPFTILKAINLVENYKINKKNSNQLQHRNHPSSLGLTLGPAQKRGYKYLKLYIYYIYHSISLALLLPLPVIGFAIVNRCKHMFGSQMHVSTWLLHSTHRFFSPLHFKFNCVQYAMFNE